MRRNLFAGLPAVMHFELLSFLFSDDAAWKLFSLLITEKMAKANLPALFSEGALMISKPKFP